MSTSLLLTCLLSHTLLLSRAAPVKHDSNTNFQSTRRFWQISDLHLDPTYNVTADHTKVCFSSKGVPASDPGLFGDFMCDSPYQLILSGFEFMNQSDAKADFIIWTGDSPPHVPLAELTTDTVISVIGNMTHTIRQFFPQLPVYPALGNHDYWPQDQFPVSTNEIYQAVAKLWSPWLGPEALTTLQEGGFYSQVIETGLRLLSLNTNLYYSPDRQTVNVSDPAGQFVWLQSTLEASRRSGEKVYVIGHVPVGYLPYARDTTAVREVYNERLLGIFRNYSDVIQGQFYGHTHRDSLMVLLDLQGQPVNSIFVAPAVTPIKRLKEPYSNNPALRLYLYQPQDYGLQDIWQFYMNLTEANQEKSAVWRLEYITTEAFQIGDVKPYSLLQLAHRFEEPHSKAFQKYFNHFMVSYNDSIVCEDDCKTTQVCSVRSLDRDSYSRCVRDVQRSTSSEERWRY